DARKMGDAMDVSESQGHVRGAGAAFLEARFRQGSALRATGGAKARQGGKGAKYCAKSVLRAKGECYHNRPSSGVGGPRLPFGADRIHAAAVSTPHFCQVYAFMFEFFKGYFGSDLAIALGTANNLIYVRARGTVLPGPPA